MRDTNRTEDRPGQSAKCRDTDRQVVLMPNNVFPYPGGKYYNVDWILSHIPQHSLYIEPFGGGATVLVNKQQVQREVFNDVDGDIVQFFQVLRDKENELIEWLDKTPSSRDLHEKYASEFYAGHRPDNDVERAGRFFYLRYTQAANKYHSKSGFLTTHRRSQAKRLTNKTEQLEQFSKRFDTVTIENLPYTEILELYDCPEALFYFDPPYVDSEHQYSESEFSHQEFQSQLKDINGKFLLSYGHCPEWAKTDNYTIKTKDDRTGMSPSGGDDKEKQEFLIMNYDPNDTPMFREQEQTALEAYD